MWTGPPSLLVEHAAHPVKGENLLCQADFCALRHTFDTRLSANGANPRLVMELMRHSDIELTMIDYTDAMLLPTDVVVDRLPSFGTEAHKEAHKE